MGGNITINRRFLGPYFSVEWSIFPTVESVFPRLKNLVSMRDVKRNSNIIETKLAFCDEDSSLPSTKNLHRQLTAIDLFAGAGGFSQAAKNVGIKILAAVEMNKKACETYEANLVENSSPRIYNEDINKLDPIEIKNNHFPDELECDILLGGPPCQGFSVHRINNSGVDDPRNQLVLRYFQYVKHLKPKIFLMENVPGILWARHRPFLDALYEEGQKSGYRLLDPVVIDARDFGVPQRRKRVFVLGIREDTELSIVWPAIPTHGNEDARSENPQLLPWLSAATIFSDPIPVGDVNNIHMNHTPEIIRAFQQTPLNGGSRRQSGRVLPCHTEHNGHSDVYGRIDPSQPGPTMTTACINPSKGRFVHPTEHHGITLRQAARFQTFPDSFVFKGGLMAGGAQVGNAVPVRLGQVLLKTIADGIIAGENSNG
ncbi:DNA (cytosine-5)-methyltransferase 1 [Janthinobacterium sp. OK676]|uniref:DNA cytosine methyltransferase n=1 Tax=Janthinobacterium sp. OK676 TaxID=1855295 RepID=UPI0008885301|nr:DNA cytosine methyltransferase [Janthinobacterium sp. OK676]SDM64202.1 DNA (cytosine-5)-methyltransferase 1 [Janthinobacterium sp. OK676]